MAKKPRKKPSEHIAQKFTFKTLLSFAEFLAAIGRPIYAFLSNLTLVIFFVIALFAIMGKLLVNVAFRKLESFTKNFKKLKRKLKSRARKKVWQSWLAGIYRALKFEKLKVTLFELKMVSAMRGLFVRIKNLPPTDRQERGKFLRKRIRTRKIIIFFSLVLFLGSTLYYFYYFIFRSLPSPNDLIQKRPQVSTKIYDRNGTILYKIFKDQNRTVVPLSQIPIHVRLATLAAEDAEFYDHPGFSVKGILRAFFQNLDTGSMQGGSTITQQLVKNVLLTPEKTLSRKIKEVILSVEVEATYTKDQILEMYLNQVSFGGTAYGIEAASQEFFGKSVSSLDLSEASYLVGLPKSPTALSPYGPTPDKGIERQHEVLHLMVVNKFITQEQASVAINEKLNFISKKNSIKAPHFVMYIRQLLVDKYGEEMVEKGGLEVVTSLDLAIQELAEKIVREEVEKIKGLNVGNGDALIVNPQTGEILAMVGSTDYFNMQNDGQVNVTLRLRQPGSSIKVVNYAYAIESGKYTPASIINDSPITYVTAGSPPYSPVNYDAKYRGNITLRSSLAQSRNIPAVKVLASYGVDKMVEMGRAMGITSWDDPGKFGLSLTLGGGAVTGLELSQVYSTLAAGGKRPNTLPIISVKDYKGKLLEKNSPIQKQILDPKTAFMLTDILRDNKARAPEFGLNSYLVIKNHPEVAVKTGTSNDLRDNWTAGYTKKYLVITWVGNNNNSPMSRIASGVTGASPIWNKIMSALLSKEGSFEWPVPDGVVKITCPGGKSEWFSSDNILPNFCSPPPTPKSEGKPDQILDGVTTRR
jgi:1A family penicillin-binding protein